MPEHTEVDTDVDETDVSDDTDHGADGGDNDDPEFLKAQLSELAKRMEKIEGAKKDAVQSRDKTKERLRELEAENKRFKEEQRKREMDRAKKREDFSSIEKQYQSDISERDSRIAALEKQIADGRRAFARNTILDQVSSKYGVDRQLTELVMLKAETSGYELPEEVDDDAVESAWARIRSLAPQGLFQKPTGGAIGGTPGVNFETKPDDEKPKLSDAQKRVREIAERRNQMRRRSG